jgi:predicted TPR repeat methyltransferase
MPGGGKLVFMQTVISVPEFILRQEQVAPHREAVTWLNDYGCGVGGTGHYLQRLCDGVDGVLDVACR